MRKPSKKQTQEEVFQDEGEEQNLLDEQLVKKLDTLKDILQDCNVSFLIGSGLSSPYFGTLGNIEIWLSDLDEDKDVDEETRIFLKACLYHSYFVVAMKDNLELLKYKPFNDAYVEGDTQEDKLNNTYKAYKDFITIINTILYSRRSNTVNKQVNLFTSNIDIFIEKIIEDLDYQFNDGFNGIFSRRFSLSNFKKSYYQKSLQYDNISEIPVFNILKIHGSVTWSLKKGNIVFSNLREVRAVSELEAGKHMLDIISLNNQNWEKNNRSLTIKELIKEAEVLDSYPDLTDFIKSYEKLQVVNPTKEKFRDTTFNKNYYEILRLYANELEKENSILFVMGFSMADEHIRDITFRAIKSNPTLKVYILSYSKAASDIIENLKKDLLDLSRMPNVELINPEQKFDLKRANELIFNPILEKILFRRGYQ